MAPLVRSYVVGDHYRVRECQYCDVQYFQEHALHPNIYEHIYQNTPDLPGYTRYAYFQSAVMTQRDPLKWLSEQEPAYWFIRNELGNVGKSVTILEIGSGLGYLTFAIRKAGYNIVGVDISEQAIGNARARFGNIYACKDLFVLSAEPARYDIVILTEVIEHVSDPIGFLNAAALLLKPGGRILMTTPNKSIATSEACWQTENPPVHLWWFSESAVRQLARRTGLSVRFGDFAAMYTGTYRGADTPTEVGAPPWLAADGSVTTAARDWVFAYERRMRWTRRLRKLAPPLYRAANRLRWQKHAGALGLQRSWQIGAVLQKRDE